MAYQDARLSDREQAIFQDYLDWEADAGGCKKFPEIARELLECERVLNSLPNSIQRAVRELDENNDLAG